VSFSPITRAISISSCFGHRYRLASARGRARSPPRITGSRPAPRARSTIDRIAAEMGDEYSLIIFPEGTRGTGESVAPFKSGLYYLCLQKPGLQLVPAFIENLNRVLPKGQFLPVPLTSLLTFGAPTSFDPLEPKLEFLERMRVAVRGLKER
jgi:1-acyl-sn-glycerol-3-phosphate acyltransferase